MDFNQLFISLLSNPEVLNYLITSIVGISLFLYNNRILIQKKQFKKLLEIAISKSEEVLETELSNEEKRDFVIKEIEKIIPEKNKKYFNEALLKQISDTAYHNYVKVKKDVNK